MPFPLSRPTSNNRFVNQDDALFDEGYDSEGGLPFHNAITDEAAEEYDEAEIGDGASVAPPPAVVHVPITEATVATLTAAGLKDELNKRGRGTGGNKPSLIMLLKSAIADGIPIQEGDVVRGAHLNGMDIWST